MIENPDTIRADFSAAMSAMYRREVPAYGTLIELVQQINQVRLDENPALAAALAASDDLSRIGEERHGAIRLGTASELSMVRRIFAVMGMFPVGYYDLSPAGIPVHSTAFRPVDQRALSNNPFRVFTSLLRLDLIADPELREVAKAVLEKRQIFTDQLLALVEKAENHNGLNAEDASQFVAEALETFRWHSDALVEAELYQQLHDAHRLIADVVSFKGPHINHLTPRTLDIDAAQDAMTEWGIAPKAVVEGPPIRKVPILLRQTSFKALVEDIRFAGNSEAGSHTARFGEIEQRGAALTPKGRALYDELLGKVRQQISPAADGSNANEYRNVLGKIFEAFPDNFKQMRQQGLVYSRYLAGQNRCEPGVFVDRDFETLIDEGAIQAVPQIYEDFLPVSAAGIFQSNLGDSAAQAFGENPNRADFERDLGSSVSDEFDIYARIEMQSLELVMGEIQNARPNSENA